MKFIIKHEIKGRMRVHLLQNRMTFGQADTLLYYLSSQKLVTGVKVREKTQDATINFVGDREEVIRALKAFHYETAKVPEVYLKNSGRELQNEYWEKLVNKVIMRMGSKMFLPVSVRSVITAIKSVKYLWHGVRTLAKGNWKFRFWMQQQSAYRSSAVTLRPQVPRCSFWESVKFSKSGLIKNQWMIWQEACHCMYPKYGW